MTAMICTLAAFLYAAAVAAIALIWVLTMKRAYESSAKEDAERIAEEMFREMCETAEYHIHSDQYILCGKGYKSQEDNITMTRATTLRPGGLYVHLSGDVYKCLRTTADGCAVLMDINSGTLLTVRGVRAYQDGKITFAVKEARSVC
jgi:hypothetical protein